MNTIVYCVLLACRTVKKDIRVFPILYWISLISRIRWIQIESVKHDWRLLKAFPSLSLTVGSLV